MPLVNSQPAAVNVTNQLPSTSNQLPDSNGDEELSEASIIQPVTPVATPNAVTHHRCSNIFKSGGAKIK